ncbi:hypothetical protein ACLOJK_006779 [Asimina triloba]
MGELHSQSESNLDEYCVAITLGSEKQGDNQLDYGNYMEVTNEIEAPNAVKFISQLEEAEKMEQELPKSCIPIIPYTPPSVFLNEENVPQVEPQNFPHSTRVASLPLLKPFDPGGKGQSKVIRWSTEHKYGAPSSSSIQPICIFSYAGSQHRPSPITPPPSAISPDPAASTHPIHGQQPITPNRDGLKPISLPVQRHSTPDLIPLPNPSAGQHVNHTSFVPRSSATAPFRLSKRPWRHLVSINGRPSRPQQPGEEAVLPLPSITSRADQQPPSACQTHHQPPTSAPTTEPTCSPPRDRRRQHANTTIRLRARRRPRAPIDAPTLIQLPDAPTTSMAHLPIFSHRPSAANNPPTPFTARWPNHPSQIRHCQQATASRSSRGSPTHQLPRSNGQAPTLHHATHHTQHSHGQSHGQALMSDNNS